MVTSTLVLEGKGRVGEYVGGYADWVRQRVAAAESAKRNVPVHPRAARASSAQGVRGEKKRRITFKETNELASLPEAIDSLERERESVYASLSDPVLLRDSVAVASATARLAAIETGIAKQLARWEELQTIADRCTRVRLGGHRRASSSVWLLRDWSGHQ